VDSRTRLIPIGKYFEIRISVDGDSAVTCIVPRVALKIIREPKP
jgi:hypothetical protein